MTLVFGIAIGAVVTVVLGTAFVGWYLRDMFRGI